MKMLTMLTLTVMIFGTGLLQAKLPSCREFMPHKHPLCLDSGGELIPSENWSVTAGPRVATAKGLEQKKNNKETTNKARCLSPFFQKGLLSCEGDGAIRYFWKPIYVFHYDRVTFGVAICEDPTFAKGEAGQTQLICRAPYGGIGIFELTNAPFESLEVKDMVKVTQINLYDAAREAGAVIELEQSGTSNGQNASRTQTR